MNESLLVEPAPMPKAAKTWHCGTLTYTKAGVITLFVFLLFGSFSFNLMMTVVPSILPLKLKSLGASDVLIGTLLTSVFPLFGLAISPYLSFKSDYLRTRWGRRKPFFFFTLPFVTLSILLLAFSEDIARLMQRSGLLESLSPATAAIAVMSVCIVAFQFSDVVIASVYNYIFNDTVPVVLTGRFFGLMQMVGASIGFLYNFFIFKYAESHMKEIFVATALVYFVGIGLLCVFVKEGEYPPVNEKEKVNTRGFSGFKTFFRESFSHKFYWTKFAYSMSPALSAALWPFAIFYYKEMGLSLDYVGKAGAVTAVAGMVAAYFASVYIDRWHPLRIIAYSGVFAATLSVGNWIWLFVTLPPMAFFWLNMLGGGLIGVFHGALCSVAAVPFDMRLQPKSRYGQFCSAQSIVTNVCKMIAGFAAGCFFEFIKNWFFPGSDYAYRFNFVWSAAASIAMGFVVCSLYRQWHQLGGDRAFNPPAPWTEKGYEEVDRPVFVGTQVRWLNHALGMTNVMMFSTLAFMIWVAYWLWHIDWTTAFQVYLFALIPVSVLLYLWWVKVERAIKADVVRCAAGEPVKDGIPHHGIFFVKAIVLLLGMPVKIGLMIVAIQDGLHTGVIVFGIGAQIADFGVILAVLILRRLERGNDPMLDYDGRKTAVA
ncbi:MAG: transporter [Rariglobus sp.]|jgi:MFS family permease|nr:transporter [Rariglobus sp.]